MEHGFSMPLLDLSLCPPIRSGKTSFRPFSIPGLVLSPFLPVLAITMSKEELCHLWHPQACDNHNHNGDDDYQSAAKPASYVQCGSASPGSAPSSGGTGSTSPCAIATSHNSGASALHRRANPVLMRSVQPSPSTRLRQRMTRSARGGS